MNAGLAARIAELHDEELLRRLGSGAQSEESIALIEAELRRRGVAVPEPEDGDFAPDDFGDASDALVEFARYGFPIEAHLLEQRLLAEGVPAWVVNANTAQAMGYLRDAVGGARVMIRPDDLEAARRVLAKLDAGDYALGEGAAEGFDENPVASERPSSGPQARGDGGRARDARSSPWHKFLLVAGISLAIASVFVAAQEPKLWWLLLWAPLAAVRWLKRCTLAASARSDDPRDNIGDGG